MKIFDNYILAYIELKTLFNLFCLIYPGFEGSSDIEVDSMSQSSADSMDIMENAPPLYEIHITSDVSLF